MRLWGLGRGEGIQEPAIGRLTEFPIEELGQRRDYIAFGGIEQLCGFGQDWRGYAGILCTGGDSQPDLPGPVVYDPPGLDYLSSGDVVALEPNGGVSVLYRRHS